MEKEKDKSTRDLTDLIDRVDHCSRKVAFLRDFFVHNVPNDELLNKNSRSGLHFILDDLEDDLGSVVDQYYKEFLPLIRQHEEAR